MLTTLKQYFGRSQQIKTLQAKLQEYEQEALRQGHIAVNSILRDLIKGQVTALECGSLSIEAVFMPFMLTSDGRPVIEAARALLPKPTGAEVVALPSASANSSG